MRSYVYSVLEYGKPLNFEFATMFSRDALTLALSDGVLVLSTGLCVPFAKLIRGGWIRYHWTGVALQHILQTTILGIAVTWTFNRYVDLFRLFLWQDFLLGTKYATKAAEGRTAQ